MYQYINACAVIEEVRTLQTLAEITWCSQIVFHKPFIVILTPRVWDAVPYKTGDQVYTKKDYKSEDEKRESQSLMPRYDKTLPCGWRYIKRPPPLTVNLGYPKFVVLGDQLFTVLKNWSICKKVVQKMQKPKCLWTVSSNRYSMDLTELFFFKKKSYNKTQMSGLIEWV